MHPLRAFLLTAIAGFAVLVGSQGIMGSLQPAPDARIGSGPLQVPTA